MDTSKKHATKMKVKRRQRIRKKLRACGKHPRLCVVKTNSHVHVQLIDDEKACTLVSASTLKMGGKNKENAKTVGQEVAKQALAKDVKKVIFDRGQFKYHGVLAALADGAREAGLEF